MGNKYSDHAFVPLCHFTVDFYAPLPSIDTLNSYNNLLNYGPHFNGPRKVPTRSAAKTMPAITFQALTHKLKIARRRSNAVKSRLELH